MYGVWMIWYSHHRIGCHMRGWVTAVPPDHTPQQAAALQQREAGNILAWITYLLVMLMWETQQAQVLWRHPTPSCLLLCFLTNININSWISTAEFRILYLVSILRTYIPISMIFCAPGTCGTGSSGTDVSISSTVRTSTYLFFLYFF